MSLKAQLINIVPVKSLLHLLHLFNLLSLCSILLPTSLVLFTKYFSYYLVQLKGVIFRSLFYGRLWFLIILLHILLEICDKFLR